MSMTRFKCNITVSYCLNRVKLLSQTVTSFLILHPEVKFVVMVILFLISACNTIKTLVSYHIIKMA